MSNVLLGRPGVTPPAPFTPDAFFVAFGIVISTEGGFTNNPSDPGNWTGGYLNGGVNQGTKFGISAAAYPHLDIMDLTLADARVIYRRDYWDHIGGDALPPRLALIVFDAAVNNGPGQAARWLQFVAGVSVDGNIGPMTIAAVHRADVTRLMTEFMAHRLMYMTSLSDWRMFGLGWARRLCALPYQAMTMPASLPSPNAVA